MRGLTGERGKGQHISKKVSIMSHDRQKAIFKGKLKSIFFSSNSDFEQQKHFFNSKSAFQHIRAFLAIKVIFSIKGSFNSKSEVTYMVGSLEEKALIYSRTHFYRRLCELCKHGIHQ